jgi:hypothetical protein
VESTALKSVLSGARQRDSSNQFAYVLTDDGIECSNCIPYARLPLLLGIYAIANGHDCLRFEFLEIVSRSTLAAVPEVSKNINDAPTGVAFEFVLLAFFGVIEWRLFSAFNCVRDRIEIDHMVTIWSILSLREERAILLDKRALSLCQE